MKYLIFPILCLQFVLAHAQYPQDYFRSPLDIDLVLAGTFGELRSNHFHSGMDIKTQQRTGLNVYAVAEGYVSRIDVSNYGYGKALYITHPNGYVSVYAHLEKYAPEIEKYVKACQYAKESYEVEEFPAASELPVSAGDLVALSGNTGSSGGPHLHFEIRDNAERPINPMLFGFEVPDKKLPYISSVYAYPKDRNSHVNESKKRVELRLIPKSDGDYTVAPIEAFGEIGFGIESNDELDGANNKNGLGSIETFFNGNKNFQIDFKRFSFAETKHLNRYIDYELYKDKSARVQKLFIQPGNTLSMFKDVENDGYVKIEDSTDSVYKIRILDFKGNDTWLSIPIVAKPAKEILEAYELNPNTYINASTANELEQENVSVNFRPNTFYEDFNIDFSVRSDTLRLHKDVVPLMNYYSIQYDISNYADDDKQQLFIAQLYGYYQRPSYISTKRIGDKLSASTKTLGTFALARDTVNPSIRPVNFKDKQWLSKSSSLVLKISDDLSGISNYRATINGKWILMEYEYKRNTLTYDFSDNINTDTENNFKLIVTDNVGNSATFEATFYRK
ncbi:M23 family metallopeptidase [Subsaximicrobium wynnwilliamsii]|uniref:M23 family metallopeptidase n=1 Tax=Subsaximicrobium wynnwilliamsii TaxID=291179 RepID=A0A5C6ZMU4_9FLAO|nr:M23 family metallopeptidase [Subsaximicrobium wynnwilliamsii]TXD85116.1 M23 family metallopeptidase [Subsaximicrobium wynnwilliamsii]TXD91159.1 M23 family metallopeptidase [Subsaximicrobium wynnwilliamsii]TXE04553.1 M23 family metallopeptidase [Subsaximicrobium wynnwilliamsii]